MIAKAKHHFDIEINRETNGSKYRTTINYKDFSDYINAIIRREIERKEVNSFQRHLRKVEKRGIIIGVPGRSFQVLEFRLPVSMVLNLKNGKDFIENVITEKVVPALRDGKVILNTNIPKDVLKAAGLSDNQYVPPKKSKKRKGIQNESIKR